MYSISQKEEMPVVTKWLLILNIAVFLLFTILQQCSIDITDLFSLHYFKSPLFKPWQLLTHMFMHGNVGSPNGNLEMSVMHLFSNMFGLWMFGSVIEKQLGTKRFLFFYLACGIGAALCHMLVLHYEFKTLLCAINEYKHNASINSFSSFINQYVSNDGATEILSDVLEKWKNDPMNMEFVSDTSNLLTQYYNEIINEATVGASGAVFGILFAFGYLFPNVILLVGFFVPLKAKYFIAIYALFELYAGINNSAGDTIAHFAHLGGLLTAFFLFMYWRFKKQT